MEKAGNGCMGGKMLDLERAEDLIKRHILLTDEVELTPTCLSDLERAEDLIKRYILLTDEVELTPTCISQETVERVAAMSKQIRAGSNV